MKTIKCWGIVYGAKNSNTADQTIEMKCNSIKEFKEICKMEGHILTDKPYVCKSN